MDLQDIFLIILTTFSLVIALKATLQKQSLEREFKRIKRKVPQTQLAQTGLLERQSSFVDDFYQMALVVEQNINDFARVNRPEQQETVVQPQRRETLSCIKAFSKTLDANRGLFDETFYKELNEFLISFQEPWVFGGAKQFQTEEEIPLNARHMEYCKEITRLTDDFRALVEQECRRMRAAPVQA